MTRTPAAVVALALGAACAPVSGEDALEDNDYDGFTADEDCNDEDPFIHPGAPETPDDGIDSDCDEDDGQHDFVGTWAVDELQAGFSGYTLLVEGTTSGDLTIAADLSTEALISGTLDPDLVGAAIELNLELVGTAAPTSDPRVFDVVLDGEYAGEPLRLQWTCENHSGAADCAGTLQVFGNGFESWGAMAAE